MSLSSVSLSSEVGFSLEAMLMLKLKNVKIFGELNVVLAWQRMIWFKQNSDLSFEIRLPDFQDIIGLFHLMLL